MLTVNRRMPQNRCQCRHVEIDMKMKWSRLLFGESECCASNVFFFSKFSRVSELYYSGAFNNHVRRILISLYDSVLNSWCIRVARTAFSVTCRRRKSNSISIRPCKLMFSYILARSGKLSKQAALWCPIILSRFGRYVVLRCETWYDVATA